MLRVLIAEDEKPAREELKYLISRNRDLRVVGEAENGREAVDLCETLAPDLVFLDIDMPVMNGIEAAEGILKGNGCTRIVFVTAYDEFAIKAFELRAVDYLLKPVTHARFDETISRLREQAGPGHRGEAVLADLLETMRTRAAGGSGRITLYKDRSLIPIDFADIVFVTACGRSTSVVTRAGRFETNFTLAELARQLEGPRFFRCHRGFIINIDCIERVDYWFNNTFLVMMKGFAEKIPVSRSRVREFRELLNID